MFKEIEDRIRTFTYAVFVLKKRIEKVNMGQYLKRNRFRIQKKGYGKHPGRKDIIYKLTAVERTVSFSVVAKEAKN